MKEFNELCRQLNEVSNTPEAKRAIAIIAKEVKLRIKEKNKNIPKETPKANWVMYDWPLNLFSIDVYQRNPDHVDRIVANFKFEYIKPATISIHDDGKAYIIDGSNTIQAMIKMGYKTIEAKTFIGLTQAQEADIFSNQYENAVRLSGIAQYDSDIIAGKKDAVEISEYLKSKKITTDFIARMPLKRNILAITKIRNIYTRYGLIGVKKIIQLILDAGWDKYDSGFSSLNIDIGIALCRCDTDNTSIRSKAYKDVLQSMVLINNPDAWHTEARRHFINMGGKHGEKYVYDYVRMLLGLIPDPLDE